MRCQTCNEELPVGVSFCPKCGARVGYGAEPPAAPPPTGDFGASLNAAIGLWKGNLGDLAVTTLVLMLLVWIPILNLGIIAGYTRAILKVSRGEGRAQVGDLFSAWDCFGNLLVFFLINVGAAFVLSFVPILGSFAAAALGFAAFPGFFAIVDRKHGVAEAYQWALSTIQADFVGWLLAYLVGNVIALSGLLLLVVGAVITMPLGQLITSRQYDRVKPA